MIFVTIGSMFPFDRLVEAVDGFASDFSAEFFLAQIGRGNYEPRNMKFVQTLEARAFRETLGSAKLVIAHAGMGSIITAMELRKPIVVLPRRAALGEVTTDHQLATARWLQGKPGIHVAFEPQDLRAAVARALEAPTQASAMSASAPEPFIDKLREYLASA